MRSTRIDYYAVPRQNTHRIVNVVEGKSPPVLPRKRMRRRFGYLIALTLIGVGGLLNLQLLLPTFAIATVVSLSVVGIAVIVQMPVRFLRDRYPRYKKPTTDDAVIT